MKDLEYEFYDNEKKWNFDEFEIETEHLTNWDMYEILKKNSNKESKILDLGTGGGEKVIKYFPEVKEILATDYSKGMIETAKKNLEISKRKNIEFRLMNNLDMDTKDEYFDIVVARHTVTDPKQIYKTLKKGGLLIIRGVDKLDCWDLKRLFGYGQGYNDIKPESQVDYESVLDANFKDVELVPIYTREYFKDKETFINFLKRVPILEYSNIKDFDLEKIDEYVKNNTKNKQIILRRQYYGITARK